MTRATRTLTATATALLLAACSATAPPDQGPTPEQRLMARPTLEQATQDYLTMLTEMRTAMARAAPNLRWTKDPHKADEAACEPPYTDIRGTTHAIFEDDPKGAIPDTAWPAVVQAVTTIGAKYRFTHSSAMISPSGDHYLVLRDDWHGSVELGSFLSSTLSVYSPCFLTEGGKNLIAHSTTPAPG